MKKIHFLVLSGFVALFTLGALTTNPQQSKKKPAARAVPAGDPYFLFLSDVHLNTKAKTCSYGDDTGLDLWKNTKAKISELLNGNNPPAFVVYAGDLPAHYCCQTCDCYLSPNRRGDHDSNLVMILRDLRNLVGKKKIPLLYTPGNNDALAGDHYSFSDSAKMTPLSLIDEKHNPYPALNVSALGGKVPCMVSEPGNGLGYYAAMPVAGLRVIVLNSVVLGNKYVPTDGVDQLNAGNMQMAWLRAQLEVARLSGQKVYLAMHIPPGINAYKNQPMWALLPTPRNTWVKNFLGLADKYHNTIAGILFGHTHMDEVRRLYDTTGSHITEVAISAPGITPQHKNNPGFKTVYFNQQTKELTDFVTWYSHPASKTWGDSSYRFSHIYHSKSGQNIFDCLSTQEIDSIGNEMNSIFTVKNGPAGYNTQRGIEVR